MSTPPEEIADDSEPLNEAIFVARPVDHRFNEGDDEVAPGHSPALSAPFIKDQHDAFTRRALAFGVIGLVGVLYGCAVLGVLAGWITAGELGKVALVLAPIQALAAAVLGFYFGQEQSK
jgi:hypothetical protein